MSVSILRGHDLDKVMREQQIPLFALESQDPIKDFDFLGITIQYEMCYTNILQVLDLAQIPLQAAQTVQRKHPIVIGGGPCTYNPEPLADFFDMFYIGEGEVQSTMPFWIFTKNSKASGQQPVGDFLKKAAQIPGIYVPSLYDVAYKEDGTIASFIPDSPDMHRRR